LAVGLPFDLSDFTGTSALFIFLLFPEFSPSMTCVLSAHTRT